MKLYEITHIHLFPIYKVSDQKGIGVFPTYEEALAAMNRVKDKEGFRQFPEGFCIDEFEVDSSLTLIDGFDPNEWLAYSKKPVKKYYWVLEFFRPYPQDDYYDEIRTIGYFSTREKAVKVKKFLENKKGFNQYKRCFYIGKKHLHQLGWEEGFITV